MPVAPRRPPRRRSPPPTPRATRRMLRTAAPGGGRDGAPRRAGGAPGEAAEVVSRTEWVIARRREAPDEGPGAARRAELVADLRAERRLAERIEAERADRTRALERVRTGVELDAQLTADAERA